MKKVAVLGLGNFGYALLAHLDSQKNLEVWGYDKDQSDIDFFRENRHPQDHLTEVLVSPRVKFTADLAELLADCDILVMAVASVALPEVADLVLPYLDHSMMVVSVIKGFSAEGLASTEVMAQHWQNAKVKPEIAGLAGGTVAKELALGQEILGMTLATVNPATARQIQEIFQSPHLRIELTSDVIGLEYASALKNIISILVGILDGLGYSFGSQTHLISQISTECQALALEHGAQKETFSLACECWGNDMIMSALGETRNRKFGRVIGKGISYQQALVNFYERRETVEGTKTVVALPALTKNLNQYPLLNFIYELAQDKVKTTDLIILLSQL